MPEKLILYCADFSLRDSENPSDFFYCILLTIDAEAHSDDSLFLRWQRGQELSGFVFRMNCIRQGRFPHLELPLLRSTMLRPGIEPDLEQRLAKWLDRFSD